MWKEALAMSGLKFWLVTKHPTEKVVPRLTQFIQQVKYV